MRLFAHVDKDEGQIADGDAIFSWGKVYEWDPYKKRGNVRSRYARFILPFVVHKEYIDPSVFEKKVGPCNWWLVCLRNEKTGKYMWRSFWKPYQ